MGRVIRKKMPFEKGEEAIRCFGVCECECECERKRERGE